MKLRVQRFTTWRGFLPFLLQAQFIFARSITGSIVGTVRDSSGLAVACAQVTITDAATGVPDPRLRTSTATSCSAASRPARMSYSR